MNFHLTERLAQRQLSINLAASKAGISEDRLREVAGGAEPSVSELRQIAYALNIPVSGLFGPLESDNMKLQFRKGATNHSNALSLLEETVSYYLSEISKLVREIPKNCEWSSQFEHIPRTVENAKAFATAFRKIYCNNDQTIPLLDLPKIIAFKLQIFLIFVNIREIDGVSAVYGSHAFILLSKRTFKPRMLFTLAHEVGHLIGHRTDATSNFVVLDKAESVGSWAHSKKTEERFADAFASALLVPEQGVAQVVSAVRDHYSFSGPLGDIEISYVARHFGVSFEVAALKCEDMELLPPGGGHALYDIIVANDKNPEQRATEAGLPKREEISFDISPSILTAAVEKVNQGKLSIGKVAEILHVPVSTLLAAHAKGA